MGTQNPVCTRPGGKQRYQVLTADLEAAFCLFLVREYYASLLEQMKPMRGEAFQNFPV